MFQAFVSFLCLFSFICSLRLAICNETENDRQALLCFKSRFSGPAGVLASWSNTSLEVCEWHGITCSTVPPRRVIELHLESEGISGPIAPCLANLTSLARLQLSNNSFNGGIPSELGLLSQLRDLNLSMNTLEGNIPPSLGSSRSLTYVDLGVNALTGVIPESLANSSSLQVLWLMSNRLIGKLPKALFNTSSLLDISLQKNNLVGSIPVVTATSPPIQYLDLRYNHISGEIPSSLGNLSSLIDLRLTENNLVGRIPDSLGHILTLEILTLTANNLSGTVPPSLFNMSSLTFLGVGNNSLVGRLPSNIGYTLPNIQALVLSTNKFDGPIPASLPKAYNLRQLYLYSNNLTGFIPFFGSLPNLEELDLSYNKLEAGDWEFVSSLANCTRLTMLMLVGNNLQGKMPSSIGNLSNSLEWLWLRENQISGPIPPEIGNLKSLSRLYMDYNLVTGNIPPTIGNLHSLVHLSFAQNRLSGQIPDTIGNLVQLKSLKLDRNNISGRIPASIGHCTQLQILNLAHNSLDGNIPSEIFKISSLSEELDLSHNYLSGGVLVEVGNLINVNKISISDNRLSGNIPSTLGQCVVLEYLDISHNNLSGKIPQFLTSLSSLQNLNLSFNNFDGAIPRGGIFYNASAVSIEGNDDLCTSIPTGGIPLCSTLVERKGKQNSSALVLQIAIPTIAVVILILSCLATIYWRKRMQENPHLQEFDDHMKKISYEDIVRSTNRFSPANLIGSGSFGVVYKGSLKLQKDQVAIKIFNLNNYGANRSFIAECEALRNVRHRNLVKIITSCSSVDSSGADFKALVFQYMPNGNLEMWLHPEDLEHGERHILTLSQRINIGLDVAFALDYLHNQCASPLIHCDLKPSNILLDLDMVAYVTDFGLSRFVFTASNAYKDSSTSLACLKGSIGYIPPEYGMSEEISSKGDVYSFGVLLLQMITGRSPTDGKFSDGASLHEFVRRAFPDNICEVVDPTMLQDDSNATEVMKNCVIPMVKIGLSCSMTSPKERPDMGQVSAEILRIKHLASHIDVR
ncbi:probable LRR receptor-like serine/threonine-protein kinase At3g47570 [Triticum aestivum]|uniref:probable LRR receptor-like serine/threonine-protein kinase At3g47570 n=1 Tax=Triticum aestivum TaxID=4565 RepID=UPI001D03243A|nr:probable LRR receptor-like serine/threonine-protein kinase At3g47570 [Triticum aestivum]